MQICTSGNKRSGYRLAKGVTMSCSSQQTIDAADEKIQKLWQMKLATIGMKIFFHGINCELWEKAIPAEVTKQEIDFLLNEFNLQPGQNILDIPCGFGRHAIELAKRGFNVTGIDISPTFIQGLTEKIKSERLDIKAIQADILSVQLNEKFSGAMCLGNSFGYFNFDRMKLFVKKSCFMA